MLMIWLPRQMPKMGRVPSMAFFDGFYGGDACGGVSGAVGDHYAVGVYIVNVRIPRHAQYFDSAFQHAVEYLVFHAAVHQHHALGTLAVTDWLFATYDCC